MGIFGLALGYLYVGFISLAGFWFGIKGGLISATVASFIFLSEVSFFRYAAFRDLVIKGMFLRFLIYYLGGIGMGYLSNVEKRLREQLKVLAYYDELTGCVNFRWTMTILENEIARAKRYSKDLAVAMIDIDHFKKINDTYGHLAGNDVLRHFAQILKESVRNVDIVGRYGGEEFLLIFPEATSEDVLTVLKRIRDRLTQTKIVSPHLRGGIFVKFSAGIASFPYNGEDLNSILSSADSALYYAKKSGRDRSLVERRRWLRLKPVKRVKIEIKESISGRGIEAKEVYNISKRGILLLFPQDISSQEFICRFSLSEEESTPAEFRCRLVHKDKSKEGIYRIGVYFVDIPKEVQEEIESFRSSPSP